MKTLKVYQSSNFKYNFFRYYHYFFDELINELKKRGYNVIEDRFFEKADECTRLITLTDNLEYNILECELLIENLTDNKIYLLSISDLFSFCSTQIQYNKRLDKVLLCQYNQNEIDNVIKTNQNKYSPWIYFTYSEKNLENYRLKKKHPLIDKLFFKTSQAWYRPILGNINKDILTDIEPLDTEDYFSEAIKHKVGLAVGGKGDICYRDIEYMGLGIPYIRFKYSNVLSEPLIPDYHYISIIPPAGNCRDRDGNKDYAKLIEDKFLEVKDNYNFLEFISNNATNYFDKYLKYPNNIYYTLQLLNL